MLVSSIFTSCGIPPKRATLSVNYSSAQVELALAVLKMMLLNKMFIPSHQDRFKDIAINLIVNEFINYLREEIKKLIALKQAEPFDYDRRNPIKLETREFTLPDNPLMRADNFIMTKYTQGAQNYGFIPIRVELYLYQDGSILFNGQWIRQNEIKETFTRAYQIPFHNIGDLYTLVQIARVFPESLVKEKVLAVIKRIGASSGDVMWAMIHAPRLVSALFDRDIDTQITPLLMGYLVDSCAANECKAETDYLFTHFNWQGKVTKESIRNFMKSGRFAKAIYQDNLWQTYLQEDFSPLLLVDLMKVTAAEPDAKLLDFWLAKTDVMQEKNWRRLVNASGQKGSYKLIFPSSYFQLFLNRLSNKEKEQLLLLAVELDEIAAVKQLIEAGVSPNAKDEVGNSVLLYAIDAMKSPACFELLLEKGTNLYEGLVIDKIYSVSNSSPFGMEYKRLYEQYYHSGILACPQLETSKRLRVC